MSRNGECVSPSGSHVPGALLGRAAAGSQREAGRTDRQNSEPGSPPYCAFKGGFCTARPVGRAKGEEAWPLDGAQRVFEECQPGPPGSRPGSAPPIATNIASPPKPPLSEYRPGENGRHAFVPAGKLRLWPGALLTTVTNSETCRQTDRRTAAPTRRRPFVKPRRRNHGLPAEY